MIYGNLKICYFSELLCTVIFLEYARIIAQSNEILIQLTLYDNSVISTLDMLMKVEP